MAENTAGFTTLGNIKATDPDGGTVTHSIVGGNVFFRLDRNSAELLTGSSALDFEEQESHTITVQATDGEDTTDVQVTISVTDVGGEAPTTPFTLAFNQGTFTVNWSAVAGASKYRVKYRVGDGEWQNRDAVTGTSDTFPSPQTIGCATSFTFTVQSFGNGSTYPASWGSPRRPAVGVTNTCP